MRTKKQQLKYVNRQIAKIETREKLKKDLEAAKIKLENLRNGKKSKR